mmetsp:Transcript_14595/g.35493  ORF Transcript_14595/g.35493 Transcript_14595/m.35493 type:complete len:421 (+) Transcript_14595:515-1777(+)
MSTVRRVLVSYIGVVCLSLLVTNNNNSSNIFVKAQSCIDDINEIYQREALVTDPSFFRQYVICPNAIYEFATYDPVGNQIEPPNANVVPPIPLRSNMNIRCGDQGSRENLCWFVGGDVQIDGTATRGITDGSIENVSIEGFVFIGSRVHGLWATKPGSITFRDCEWRDFDNSQVPIMLDYFDGDEPDNRLVVSFVECEFRDNRYFGIGSQNALIYGNSNQNVISITKSLFERNDMVFNNTRADTHSFLVESLGQVAITNTCFQDNAVGTSDVVVFGNGLRSADNFITNSSGSLCEFSAVFQTVQQFDAFTPICIEATETTCERFATASPTDFPSASPSVSMAPSTSFPTITAQPTEFPSFGPTQSPSEPGDTLSPTIAPTLKPVEDFELPGSAASLLYMLLDPLRMLLVSSILSFIFLMP